MSELADLPELLWRLGPPSERSFRTTTKTFAYRLLTVLIVVTALSGLLLLTTIPILSLIGLAIYAFLALGLILLISGHSTLLTWKESFAAAAVWERLEAKMIASSERIDKAQTRDDIRHAEALASAIAQLRITDEAFEARLNAGLRQLTGLSDPTDLPGTLNSLCKARNRLRDHLAKAVTTEADRMRFERLFRLCRDIDLVEAYFCDLPNKARAEAAGPKSPVSTDSPAEHSDSHGRGFGLLLSRLILETLSSKLPLETTEQDSERSESESAASQTKP